MNVREVQGIKRVHLLEDKGHYKVQTEGVNFEAVWAMSQVDHSRIQCNDIHSIYKSYGVSLLV